MDATRTHTTATPDEPAGHAPKHRRGVTDRLFEAEGRWLMGRIMPRERLEGMGKCLGLVAPGREEEIVAGIRARAEALAEGDRDMVVDGPSQGMLAMSAVVLAAHEALLPVFGGDE